MTDSTSSSSSSFSSNYTRKRNHVFISFSGEDTRKNFTSHLYHAFCVKKINAYIDEESLKKGDEISASLLKAIEESKISVIILSENYASSRWCLDELNHILRCYEANNQIVVPVFYGVDPSQVRKQQGSYALALAGHEDRFKDQMEKVQQWRNSLTRVADFSGFDSSNYGSDSKLVEKILHHILEELYRMFPGDDSKDLVGLDKPIQDIESMLKIDSSDVRIIGIWGMGGIGKTTLARVIFNRFAYRFEACYFLENVKEESKRHGLLNLQAKLFSEILSEGKSFRKDSLFVKDRLRSTEVLLVLDDMDNVEQWETLVGDHWFGHGSKVIVTSRDMEVLQNIGAHETYEVEELNFNDSLQLFCSKAFKQSSPRTDYEEYLSQRVVSYAKGIPLVLKVLGCHLYSKTTKEWESALDKLRKNPNKKILDSLKISYDGLEENEQQIFLDIACFFKDEKENYVREKLSRCFGHHVDIGIRILINRSLIALKKYDSGNTYIQMHDLLQQMGQRIVHEESKEPGERSRLWLIEDIRHVLKYNTGGGRVQAISLNTDELGCVIRLGPRVFKKMYNLKFLNLSNSDGNNYLYLPKGLKSLPDELRSLCWDQYPLKSLPQDFAPQNLVELRLRNSPLEHLWNGQQNLANLKLLDLSQSKNLAQIPDLSRAAKLEEMKLISCTGLESFPEVPVNIKYLDMGLTSIEQVPPSIERLSHLKFFCLGNCKKLKSLPSNLWKLKSLKELNIQGCSDLECLPEISEPMKHLEKFQLTAIGIRKLPSSIENLVNVGDLDLAYCKNLQFIPSSIYSNNMRIHCLNFSYCSKLETLPPFSNGLLFLDELYLEGTGVSEIPDWIFRLPKLHMLCLGRTRIKTLPVSIKSSKLRVLFIEDCKSLQSLPELPLSIYNVYASGCTSLRMVSNMSVLSNRQTERVLLIQELGNQMKSYHTEEFMFNDCLMLDQNHIVTEFQIRAFRLGAVLLKRRNEIINQRERLDPQVCIDISGNEIPKWFNHQNDNGCSINMKLPPHCCYDTTSFMGFASCLVVNVENGFYNVNAPDFNLECVVNVETNDVKRRIRFQKDFAVFRKDSRSSHVVMWYFHSNNIDLSSAKEISFEFRAFVDLRACWPPCSKDDPRARRIFNVEKCGINVLLLQEAVEFGVISSESIHGESNVINAEVEPSGPEIVDLETNEPLPKRAKFSSFP
ncbi:TIR-NBS-LRR-like protein [Parasponia andersonii]|uniref:ADP-ribosyl cyclase/cyclic ADP-ribose hydrolase n=1 Tax=Parasponia andersonii TaxID=3476 RepID=A0A2P5A509_PARAD|nr:TIR-NBS-LRR-like protein [Parasponia andersonii]